MFDESSIQTCELVGLHVFESRNQPNLNLSRLDMFLLFYAENMARLIKRCPAVRLLGESRKLKLMMAAAGRPGVV